MSAQPASGLPPAGEPLPDAPAARPWVGRRVRAEHIRDYGILVVTATLFIGLAIASDAFLTSSNLLNILYQNAPVGIMACAVTLVIIAGFFDLSLGAMYALTAVCAAEVALHVSPALGLAAGIVGGGALGLANGLIVTRLRVNAFLGTLATSLVFRGVAVAITGGFLVQVSSTTFTWVGREKIGDVPWSVIIFVVVAVFLQFILARTVFGRYVYAIGGNRDAADLSGVRVDAVAVATFVIAGLAAGLAGVIDASTTGSGDSSSGLGLELTAIAAVALGGTSIYGGVGSVWRTVVGVILFALITNGFNLLGVQPFYQDISKGVLVVLAVALGSVVERRDRR